MVIRQLNGCSYCSRSAFTIFGALAKAVDCSWHYFTVSCAFLMVSFRRSPIVWLQFESSDFSPPAIGIGAQEQTHSIAASWFLLAPH